MLNACKYCAQWARSLQSLTPGGSEFAGDPKACEEYLRHQRDLDKKLIVKLMLENRELRSKLNEVKS